VELSFAASATAVCPRVHPDETRTQGLDRLELIRFLQIARTISVHHGTLAYLLGINALRASEAAAVRIEDHRETLRGNRVLHVVGKGYKPATMPLTSRPCAFSKPAVVNAPKGRSSCARCRASRWTAGTATEWSPASRKPRGYRGTSARTRYDMPRSATPSTQVSRCETPRASTASPPPRSPGYERAKLPGLRACRPERATAPGRALDERCFEERPGRINPALSAVFLQDSRLRHQRISGGQQPAQDRVSAVVGRDLIYSA